MKETGKERFILTKAYEVAYALFRLAAPMQEKDFAESLRASGTAMLSAAAAEDYAAAARSLHMLAVAMGTHKAHRQPPKTPEDLGAALEVVKGLNASGFQATMDILGEDAGDAAHADGTVDGLTSLFRGRDRARAHSGRPRGHAKAPPPRTLFGPSAAPCSDSCPIGRCCMFAG